MTAVVGGLPIGLAGLPCAVTLRRSSFSSVGSQPSQPSAWATRPALSVAYRYRSSTTYTADGSGFIRSAFQRPTRPDCSLCTGSPAYLSGTTGTSSGP
ncbi:hypothetical protein [Kribbella soli]|uniref:hypothetical protein n=1 Tax=Kribbella soli TaxID=1124743 RepID=UPI001EDD8348|nr:hypothetical protein [Kribbella soli]